MNSPLELMDFVLRKMDQSPAADDRGEFCVKTDEFWIQNDEFWIEIGSRCR